MRRPLYVFATLGLVVGGIVLIERFPLLRGARSLESGLVFVLFAVCAWVTMGRLRNVFVVLCSLTFGVGVLDALVPVLTGGRTSPQRAAVKDDHGLAGAKPLVGWGPLKPGVFPSIKTVADGTEIWNTSVTIDSHLNRKTVPSNGPRPIAFFGDSWIYGDGVNDDGTIPQAFADLNHGKIPVLNLSFAGWSPAQNLVALQKGLYSSLLDRPRHFILFTATFHVERTACKNDFAISQAPRFVLDGDRVTFFGACADSRGFLVAPLMRLVRRFAIYDRLEAYFATPARQDVETYIKILETFVATAKKDYDVETTILFAPFRDQYIRGSGYTETQIIDKLRQSGIDVLIDQLPDVPNDDVYWIPIDGHPTALANRERAKAIEAHLQKVDPAALATGDAEVAR